MGILELHFHDSEFTFAPAGRFGAKPTDEESERATTPPPEVSPASGEGSPAGAAALVALFVLFAIAVAVRKLRGGDEEGVPVEIETAK